MAWYGPAHPAKQSAHSDCQPSHSPPFEAARCSEQQVASLGGESEHAPLDVGEAMVQEVFHWHTERALQPGALGLVQENQNTNIFGCRSNGAPLPGRSPAARGERRR